MAAITASAFIVVIFLFRFDGFLNARIKKVALKRIV